MSPLPSRSISVKEEEEGFSSSSLSKEDALDGNDMVVCKKRYGIFNNAFF